MSQAEGKVPASLQAGSIVSGEAVGEIAQPVEKLQILLTNDSCRFVDERKLVGKSVRGTKSLNSYLGPAPELESLSLSLPLTA